MRQIFLTCCVLALLAIAGPASAKDADEYAVRKIEYKNKGAYSVSVFKIMFKVENTSGKTVTCRLDGEIKRGSSTSIQSGWKMSFNLNKESGFTLFADNPDGCNNWNTADDAKPGADDAKPGYVPVGSEVWARLQINAGDLENCHKEKKTKFYYHPDGGTVTYVTRGTTLNNNRCRIQSKGGVLWKDVQ